MKNAAILYGVTAVALTGAAVAWSSESRPASATTAGAKTPLKIAPVSKATPLPRPGACPASAPSNQQYLWVTPAEFVTSANGDTGFITPGYLFGRYVDGSTGLPKFMAPVRVPENATINEIRFEFVDNEPTMFATVQLSTAHFDQDGSGATTAGGSRYSSEGRDGKYAVRDCSLQMSGATSSSAYTLLSVGFYNSGTPPKDATVRVSGIRIGYTTP
ncbi:MAG: hypothetical protein JW940_38435 [Polyangiaceae bacterium]|nr:hypothetical protein [Polyangiaceae bacterium]